jgi:pimeloyl-ACP methyl ester carboxylesterase
VSAPHLLRSLVIVNSGPEIPLPNIKARLQALITYLQRLFIVRVLGMRKMGEVLSKRLLPAPEHADLRRTFVERWAENDKDAYLASLRALAGWSVADRLHQIATPTLVLASDQDYTSLAFKQSYVARMPHAELVVIDDARHMLPIERAAAFNQALQAFLGKQPIPA